MLYARAHAMKIIIKTNKSNKKKEKRPKLLKKKDILMTFVFVFF